MNERSTLLKCVNELSILNEVCQPPSISSTQVQCYLSSILQLIKPLHCSVRIGFVQLIWVILLLLTNAYLSV